MSEIHYGSWAVVDRTYQSPTYGEIRTESRFVWFGLDDQLVLPLPEFELVQTPTGNETERKLKRYGVVVTDINHIPPAYAYQEAQFDADGFRRPARGVFVEQDTIGVGDVVLNRAHHPPSSYHPIGSLYEPSGEFNHTISYLHNSASAVKTEVDNETYSGPGALVLAEYDTVFGWLDRNPLNDLVDQTMFWYPGRAGPTERVLLGTGLRALNHKGWLVYAIDTVVVVEFWDGRTLLASRMLDCMPLMTRGYSDERYLIAFGYNWKTGRVALGVTRKGTWSGQVFRDWHIPELQGFGYEQPQLYVGGGPMDYDLDASGNPTSIVGHRSAWGWVKPIQGSFTTDRSLNPGLMASLSEHI